MTLRQANPSTNARDAGAKVGGWLAASVVVLLLLLYLAYLPRRAPHAGLYTGDEGIRVMQVEGMKRHGFGLFHNPSPRIDPDVEFFYDPALRRARGGPVWMIPPFFALISLPGYAQFGLFGLHLLPAAGAVLSVLALWRAAIAAAGRWYAGIIAAALFGLASPAIFYGADFSEHAVATGLAMAGMCCCLVGRDRWWGAAACGLLCAAATSLRTECVVVVPAAAVVVCFTVPWRRAIGSIIALGAGALVLLVPLAVLNAAWFGTPWGLHASGNVWRSGILGPASVLGPLRTVLVPREAYQIAPIAAAVVLKLLGMAPGASQRWRVGCHWAYAGALVCLAAAVVVPPVADKALFVVAPWALCMLGPVGVTGGSATGGSQGADRGGASRAFAGLATASALYIVVVLLAAPGTGGALWGPRFLLPGIALLALTTGTAIALTLEPARHGVGGGRGVAGAMTVAFVALLLAGGQNAARSLGSLCTIKQQNELLLSHFAEHTEKGDVIISDTWWLAQVSAVLVYQRHFFIIPGGPDAEARIGKLLNRLRRLGITRIHYVTARDGPSPLRSRIAAEGTLVRSRRLVPYEQRMETYVLRAQ